MKKLLGKGKVIVSIVSVFAILAVSLLSIFTGVTFVASADDADATAVTYPINGKYDADVVVKDYGNGYTAIDTSVKTVVDKFTGFNKDFDEGDGTARRPYIIKTANQFAAVAGGKVGDTTGVYFKVADNVKAFDLSNTDSTVDFSKDMSADEVYNALKDAEVQTAWAEGEFGGVFDGNGVEIYGLKFENVSVENDSGLTSLFAKSGANPVIRNLTVKNCYFNGNRAAVLFSHNDAAGKKVVQNCVFKGNVVLVNFANDAVTAGGIISGLNWYDETLEVSNTLSYGNIAKHATYDIKYSFTGRYHGTTSATITNSVILDNVPYAVYCGSNAFRNSTFTNVYTNTIGTAWTNIDYSNKGADKVVYNYNYTKEGSATFSRRGYDATTGAALENDTYKYDMDRTFEAGTLVYADYADCKGDALKSVLGGAWTYADGKYPTPNIYSVPEFSKGDAWSGEIAYQFSGGEGTSSAPYMITTAEEFALMLKTAERGQYYKLAADIKINDTTDANWTANAKKWFTSNDVAPFVATLDGAGYTVSGLYYDGSQKGEYAGLIPELDYAATVKNIKVDNSSIKASSGAAGAVVGAVADRASKVISLSSITVADTVTFDGRATNGGIIGKIGYSVVRMSDCISESNGLFGELTGEAKVSRCISVNAYPFGTTDGVVAKDVYTDTDGTAIDGLTVTTVDAMQGEALKSVFGTDAWKYENDKFPTFTYAELSAAGTVGEVWTGAVASFADIDGNGTEDDPWLIDTAEKLAYAITKHNNENGTVDNQKYFKLTADIYLNDVNSKMWEEKIGCNEWYSSYTSPAKGFKYTTLDGDGYFIYGLYYDNPDIAYLRGGLIPQVTVGTVVQNLGISEAYMVADSSNGNNCVGTIFGLVRSWITEEGFNSWKLDTHDGPSNKAIITSEEFIKYEPKIINCFVDHTSYISSYNTGGMIGMAWNQGSVYMENCLFTGSLNTVSDHLRYGTFIGDDSSYGTTIKNSVSLPLTSQKLWGGTDGATWRTGNYIMNVCENVYYFATAVQNGGGLMLTKLNDPTQRMGTAAKDAMPNLDWEETPGDGGTWRVMNGTPILAIFGKHHTDEELERFTSETFETPYTTISFMTNTNDIVVPDMTGQMYSKVSLPIITRPGYKFTGWYVFDDLTLLYPKDYYPPRDLTLYAGWESTGVVQDFEDYTDSYYDYDSTQWRLNKPGAKGGYKNAYVRNGGRSMRLLSTNTEAADFLINYQDMLTPGKAYTMTFWVATDKADNPATLLTLVHNSIPEYYNSQVAAENIAIVTGLKVGEWVQYSYSFTAQTKWVSMRASAGSSLYFDDIVIGEIEGTLNGGNLIGLGTNGAGSGLLSPGTGDKVTVVALVSAILACAVVAVISKKNLVEVID